MIVIIGLLVLIAAAVVAVAAVATNSGSAHPLGDNFVVFGHHVTGLSTGQLFLCGLVVGVVGMLGLSLLVRPVTRRFASRGSRRELKESRRETEALRVDRDRLTQQLDDGSTPPPDEIRLPADKSTAEEPATAERSPSRHRLGHHADR
jgi:hypothetical protein